MNRRRFICMKTQQPDLFRAEQSRVKRRRIAASRALLVFSQQFCQAGFSRLLGYQTLRADPQSKKAPPRSGAPVNIYVATGSRAASDLTFAERRGAAVPDRVYLTHRHFRAENEGGYMTRLYCKVLFQEGSVTFPPWAQVTSALIDIFGPCLMCFS